MIYKDVLKSRNHKKNNSELVELNTRKKYWITR